MTPVLAGDCLSDIVDPYNTAGRVRSAVGLWEGGFCNKDDFSVHSSAFLREHGDDAYAYAKRFGDDVIGSFVLSHVVEASGAGGWCPSVGGTWNRARLFSQSEFVGDVNELVKAAMRSAVIEEWLGYVGGREKGGEATWAWMSRTAELTSAILRGRIGDFVNGGGGEYAGLGTDAADLRRWVEETGKLPADMGGLFAFVLEGRIYCPMNDDRDQGLESLYLDDILWGANYVLGALFDSYDPPAHWRGAASSAETPSASGGLGLRACQEVITQVGRAEGHLGKRRIRGTTASKVCTFDVIFLQQLSGVNTGS